MHVRKTAADKIKRERKPFSGTLPDRLACGGCGAVAEYERPHPPCACGASDWSPAGLSEARRALAEGMLNYARREAGRYARTQSDPADAYERLFSTGAQGCCKAALLFRPECGTAFSTYAVYAVKHLIWHELKRMQADYRVANLSDVAACGEAMGCLPEGGMDRLLEPLDGHSHEAADEMERADAVALVVRAAAPGDRALAVRYYKGGETLTQIGQSLRPPVSKERVRQRITRALARMREAAAAAGLTAADLMPAAGFARDGGTVAVA
jgi:RNA polymerase sigma factor (sigma-70 family)